MTLPLILAVLLIFALSARAADPTKPNLSLILAEDIGPPPGFYSAQLVSTRQRNKKPLPVGVNTITDHFRAAPEQQYVGTSRRNPYYGDTGRSYALGVHWNY